VAADYLFQEIKKGELKPRGLDLNDKEALYKRFFCSEKAFLEQVKEFFEWFGEIYSAIFRCKNFLKELWLERFIWGFICRDDLEQLLTTCKYKAKAKEVFGIIRFCLTVEKQSHSIICIPTVDAKRNPPEINLGDQYMTVESMKTNIVETLKNRNILTTILFKDENGELKVYDIYNGERKEQHYTDIIKAVESRKRQRKK